MNKISGTNYYECNYFNHQGEIIDTEYLYLENQTLARIYAYTQAESKEKKLNFNVTFQLTRVSKNFSEEQLTKDIAIQYLNCYTKYIDTLNTAHFESLVNALITNLNNYISQ